MGCFIFGSGGGKRGGDNLDFSQVNIEPQYALAGKKFYNKNKELKTGTILNWDRNLKIGSSSDPNKRIIQPSLQTRVLTAGKYLACDMEFAPITNPSPTPYVLDHTYARSSTEFRIVPMDYDMDDSLQNKMFAVSAFAHGSVSDGEFAAFTLSHTPIEGWVLYVYKMGYNPFAVSEGDDFSMDYYAREGVSEYPGYWRLKVSTKDNYYLFSTSKYYEGFGLYL